MRGGIFDRLVTFQKPATIDDPVYGPQEGGWADFASRIPAQVIQNLPGAAESVQNGLKMADRPARVRIRYMRGLTSDMRVIVHNETDEMYEISGGPAEIGRREGIELTIKEYSS
jgi:head-tail adaptor